MLDLLLDRLRELGLVEEGGRQRTDSTHIVSAARELNRLEPVGESVRAALNALSAAAPDCVQVLVVSDWSRRYADRVDTRRIPDSRSRQHELALDEVVSDNDQVVAAFSAEWAGCRWEDPACDQAGWCPGP
ncbi:hypothetical protein [Streptomyces sp. NBC_01477]|uniref:hypothetical protein n=1 Tax=Streptomyces sp. NBC_01477 TaxID=2976015 RepID=UPI002E30A58E|nr:hypothetical protein [Streptomyces sp. NBC_01477]